MQTIDVKQEAHHLLEKLPENATWDDLMFKIYVRQAIEAGIEDSEAGRSIDVKDVRAKLDYRSECSLDKHGIRTSTRDLRVYCSGFIILCATDGRQTD